MSRSDQAARVAAVFFLVGGTRAGKQAGGEGGRDVSCCFGGGGKGAECVSMWEGENVLFCVLGEGGRTCQGAHLERNAQKLV